MLQLAKLIFAMFVMFGVAEASITACQRLSVLALKQKLLAAGGTLNPQLVAITADGARRFKSHVNVQTTSRIISRANSDVDNYTENDDEDIEDLYDGDLYNNHDDNDDDDERKLSRNRRSTTVGTCYSPGTAVNNRYLLCHICDSTTVLSTDYFPRYINEIICNPNAQATCFRGQGECAANAIPTVFLKKTGQCVTNSEGIFVEGWEAVTKFVRTCCECKLYPGSFLIPWTV